MRFASVLAGVACFSGAALCQTKLKFSKLTRSPIIVWRVDPRAGRAMNDEHVLTLRIVPLGDSITEITCWRALLWDSLVAANVSARVQFVGSTTSNTMNCRANDPAWDKRHEGHSGFLAVDIARNNLPGWLRLNQPDIVNFMLGTNGKTVSRAIFSTSTLVINMEYSPSPDVSRGKTTAEVINAYTSIVTQLRAANPKVKIIVCGLLLLANPFLVLLPR